MTEWQPIETAPRDGSWFLGGWHFQEKFVYRLCRWNEYHKAFNQVPGYHSGPFEVWQPLPEPPAIANKLVEE